MIALFHEFGKQQVWKQLLLILVMSKNSLGDFFSIVLAIVFSIGDFLSVIFNRKMNVPSVVKNVLFFCQIIDSLKVSSNFWEILTRI